MQLCIEVIFVVGVAVAIPGVPPYNSDECQAAQEKEQCMEIYQEAVNAPGPVSMRERFQHYCRKITDFVPCLQENEADYETLLHCPEGQDTVSAVMSRFGYLMTWEEVFNFTIDFTDTVNHIVCTRSDEIINLLYCLKNKAREFRPLVYSCAEAMYELGTKVGHDEVTDAEICSSIFGYTSCLKDGIINVCGSEYRDLLDTAYNDIVAGVFGDSFGCDIIPFVPVLDLVQPLLRNEG